MVIYNLIIGLSLAGVLINYFQLIIKQLEGFIPSTKWLGIGVMLLLIMLTLVMKYYSFGERLLAIGIISIVGYVGFLIWAQATAEHYPKILPPTGPKYIDLAASLIMGYSIHDFVVQVLFKTTTNDKFIKVVGLVYVAGTIIYTFISYGAYAILNREPRVA